MVLDVLGEHLHDVEENRERFPGHPEEGGEDKIMEQKSCGLACRAVAGLLDSNKEDDEEQEEVHC